MAKLVVLQQKQPSLSLLPSSLSEFSGIRLSTSIQYKRKVWKPQGALNVTASSSKKILIMGGTRFIGVFLSRLLVKEGHEIVQYKRKTWKAKGVLNARLPVKDNHQTKDFAVPRRNAMALMFLTFILSRVDLHDTASAQQPTVFREYIDTFDGYSFQYPRNWIEVRGAGADIFFRDPFILDENLSVEFSSPSSSTYKSIEDLGSPQQAAEKVLKQYLTEFMSTRLGVRRESNILTTSSRVGDDGRTYYQVEVNIKSYANNNELAVMPQDRVTRLEWDRRYLSVLGVENKQLYELRLQTPESVFAEEESDLRRVMDSFRVNKIGA